MSSLDGRSLPRLVQLVPVVLPHRLEQSISRLLAVFDHHQRRIYQPRQEIENFRPIDTVLRADSFRRLQREPAANAERRRDSARSGRAPIHGSAPCLMLGQARPRACCQQSEWLVQPRRGRPLDEEPRRLASGHVVSRRNALQIWPRKWNDLPDHLARHVQRFLAGGQDPENPAAA